jgi:hypothetical protein
VRRPVTCQGVTEARRSSRTRTAERGEITAAGQGDGAVPIGRQGRAARRYRRGCRRLHRLGSLIAFSVAATAAVTGVT